MYDPDEMDQEQRERQLRKRLNEAFQGFCKKVEIVSGKYGNKKEFDIPYRDLAFQGTPNKEMCTIQPTLNCLVNLTETPFFVVDLEKVDHVHFERITFSSKAFDVIIILKDFTKQPMRIDMIANADKDGRREWQLDRMHCIARREVPRVQVNGVGGFIQTHGVVAATLAVDC